LHHLLHENTIAFLDRASPCSTRDAAISALIDLLVAEGRLSSHEPFRSAIFQREQIVSTGIGMGIAIPHAKLKGLSSFFIAIGILQAGIDWNALDGAPVRLIFLIGGPEEKQTEYLHILSQLTRYIKDAEFRSALLKAGSPQDVIDLYTETS
jgi:PTS system nitrogen regulatory IIA component